MVGGRGGGGTPRPGIPAANHRVQVIHMYLKQYTCMYGAGTCTRKKYM